MSDSGYIETPPQEWLGPACAAGNFESTAARLEASGYGMFRGFEGGLIQDAKNGRVEVHCFRTNAVVSWPFRP